MEKKSTLPAKAAAAAAVAASSTIMPSGGGSTPAALAALASSTRTVSTSSSSRTIGIMTARSVPAPACRIAASWSASAPGARRNAGSPAEPGNGGTLSPAKSSSRTTARLPRSWLRTGVSAARCSARPGQPEARVNGISVRSRPTPAAPLARPRRVSAAEATLHRIVTRAPSAVRAAPCAPGAAASPAARTRARSAGTGSTTQLTAARVKYRLVPGGRAGHGRVGAGEHRQPEAAGDDRGVRARAAAHRHRAGQVPGVDEADQVGGVDFRADQDERALGRRCHGRAPGEGGGDRGGDLTDVARPLGEVRVGQRLEDRGLGLRRRGDRGRGRRQREAPGIIPNGCVLLPARRRLRCRGAGRGTGERVKRRAGQRRVGRHQGRRS